MSDCSPALLLPGHLTVLKPACANILLTYN